LLFVPVTLKAALLCHVIELVREYSDIWIGLDDICDRAGEERHELKGQENRKKGNRCD